ncbi:MAG: hypothetical protein ACR2K2_08150 [Mycobacteriales bacterium]
MGGHRVLRRAAGDGQRSAARAIGAVHEARDTSLIRGGAAWDAVRGARVGPPTAVRRWPWALAAAVLGAAAGGAVAVLVRRLGGQDAPGALEPAELKAVVDRPAQ